MWTIVVKVSVDNPTADRVIGLFATSFAAEKYAASILTSEYYYIREIKGIH